MAGTEATKLPEPRHGCFLHCVRCDAALFYVRQDRPRGVLEHRYECRRCGQQHAAGSSEWTPAGMGIPKP